MKISLLMAAIIWLTVMGIWLVSCVPEEGTKNRITWLRNEHGLHYYESCIQGQLFYVGQKFMAGPVRDCES